MNEKKYRYSYNISTEANQKAFIAVCKLIEKNLSNLEKEKLLIDVDGSLIQTYYLYGKKIVVCDDYYVDALYVDSDVELGDILGRKSIY